MRCFSRARARTIIALLLVILIIPASFIFSPQRADAQTAVTVVNNSAPTDLLDLVKNTVTSVASVGTQGSTAALVLKGYVLDPLVRVLAQAVLQSVTASVINWINGNGSGGQPLFVQNLGQYLLLASDNAALHFFAEITGNSNSPFAPIIASSLEATYLQSTSAAGFWAANQCTLNAASSNISSFLAGNFSQGGGWGAWFALTTQPQNNPYTLYYRTQAELNARIAASQSQNLSQLNWGQGFVSWCGNTSSSASGSGGSSGSSSGNTGGSGTGVGELANEPAYNGPAIAGVTNIPGTPCTNPDGSTGTIQTPGTTIASSLNKALGAGQDSLISAQQIDGSVNAIFAALALKVLGGLGLAGASATNGITAQLAAANGLLTQSPGSTGGTVGSSLTTSLTQSLQTFQEQVEQYQSAWQSLGSAASTASTTLGEVISCENATGASDTYGAQAALTGEVAPVVAQAASAASTSAADTASIQSIGYEISAAQTTTAVAQAASDLQTLVSMPPSTTDATNAQSNDQTTGGATSTTATSLHVSGGTTLDQMNLINTNGNQALGACEAQTAQQQEQQNL